MANIRFKLRIPQNRKWAAQNNKYSYGEKIEKNTLCALEMILNSKQQVMGKLGHVVQIRTCHVM